MDVPVMTDGRADLLSSIRAGTKLRKVSVGRRPGPGPSFARAAASGVRAKRPISLQEGGGMTGALFRALELRNKRLAEEKPSSSSSDPGDDSDWDD